MKGADDVASALEAESKIENIDVAPESDPELEIQPRGLVKRLLPRTMFGRSLLIVVMPLVILQAIATWIFYDRHWAAVSWRLSTGVAGDIALLIDAIQLAPSDPAVARLLRNAAAAADLDVTFGRGETLPAPPASSGVPLEEQLVQAMQGRVNLPYRREALLVHRGTKLKVTSLICTH